MEAIVKTEEDESENVNGITNLPDKVDTDLFLQNYQEEQASSVTDASNSTVETNVDSIDKPRGEQPTGNEIPVVKDDAVTTPPNLSPADGVTNTPKQKSEVQVRKSLNPFSPDSEENPKYVILFCR